jgi:hypothetical protein
MGFQMGGIVFVFDFLRSEKNVQSRHYKFKISISFFFLGVVPASNAV